MELEIIEVSAAERRQYWIGEICAISGNFGQDTERVVGELRAEFARDGISAILDHLRLCGSIPETYGHDSSEEKLYSKYTDALLSLAYESIGFDSRVLTERADAADVEVAAPIEFVADAKVFRLSRTAKNQKDFKVQAMDNWKRGAPHAMVVCPIYQLPSNSSQIYSQAGERNVCVFTYSHLSLIVRYAAENSQEDGIELMRRVFDAVQNLEVSKSAESYWTAVNRSIRGFHPSIPQLWEDEQKAVRDSLRIAKSDAISLLEEERRGIQALGKEEAIQQLIEKNKIDSRINVINSVDDTRLL